MRTFVIAAALLGGCQEYNLKGESRARGGPVPDIEVAPLEVFFDVLVSGDGDPRVFFFEQSEPGVFTQHTVLEEFGQAGGMKIQDLDGDGDAEMIMVGYEADAVLVFEKQ